MRKTLFATILAVIAVFSGIVIWRLSIDALALVVGLALGVLVMLPLSAVSLWIVRSSFSARKETIPPQLPTPPPVIVVQPAAFPHQAYSHPVEAPKILPAPPSAPWPSERRWQFHVYGDADAMEEADRL